MLNDIQRLCRTIHYRFKDEALLKRALTHRSVNKDNNERLEFLGDSILGFVIANLLFQAFPNETEGKLSRLRAHLVKEERLAEIAGELELGDYLILGPGELKSGGHRRQSILADAFEAVIAAIYLDGGIESAQMFIITLYENRVKTADIHSSHKDDKTLLQEFLQSKKQALPIYVLDKTTGEEHHQLFYVSCHVNGITPVGKGRGSTRRKAEQEAAKALLQKLL